ncbi:Trp biosynthesis-associated membrane protein, partial [Agromyces sp. Marseille-Q5079]|uniref:Trp biosynthesis-associated membrane protein n=1 Tax=Agromyces sp. Marseille-Q5079 TaxID=3439059 RepID=UPI003D9CB684
GSIILAGALALGDPVAAVGPAVTDATGVAGSRPTAELVASADPTLWPTAAIIGGVLVVVAGLLALVTTRRWPGSSRRYSAVRTTDAETGEPVHLDEVAVPTTDERRQASDRAVDAWDELSRGDDPTDEEAAVPRTTDDEPSAEREGPVDPSR